MSHFYGTLQGCRGATTRTGSKGSGIQAHIRSWNNDVYAELKDNNGEDILFLTIPEKLNKVIMNGDEIDIKLIHKHWEKVAKMIKEIDVEEQI